MATLSRDERDAALAAVLAQAAREGRVLVTDALRVIKHEMRRRNTNQKHRLPYRSARAQAVIDEYAARGETPPKNGSDNALHADHVYELGEAEILGTGTPQEWARLLSRARTVVVVTARENYDLEILERAGVRGPAKYAKAGVTWAGVLPPFVARAAATCSPSGTDDCTTVFEGISQDRDDV